MKKIPNQVNPPRKKYPFAKDDKFRIILKDKSEASMVLCKGLPYVSCRILIKNIEDFMAKHEVTINGKFCIIR